MMSFSRKYISPRQAKRMPAAAHAGHSPLMISAAGVKGPHSAGFLSLPNMESQGTWRTAGAKDASVTARMTRPAWPRPPLTHCAKTDSPLPSSLMMAARKPNTVK